MKTKVVVSGGYAEEINELNQEFFKEILKDTEDDLNVLLVLFSRPESKWEVKSINVTRQFDAVKNNKKLNYVIATHDDLEEQVIRADIIYIRGGDNLLLLEAMSKHPKFVELIKGKIVAGESAGTYLLSDYFYSKSKQGIFRGLGVLPVRTICHFEGKNEEYLDACPEDLEKLLLKSFEHKVYYISE